MPSRKVVADDNEGLYNEDLDVEIICYSLEKIVAEMLRALLQAH